jgi:hypothetical protein
LLAVENAMAWLTAQRLNTEGSDVVVVDRYPRKSNVSRLNGSGRKSGIAE